MDPEDLNEHLKCRSYLIGNKYTYADAALHKLIEKKRDQYTRYGNIIRWFDHINRIKVQEIIIDETEISGENFICNLFARLYLYIML